MAIYVVPLTDVVVRLTETDAVITIHLPHDYRSVSVSDARARRELEGRHVDAPAWIRHQLEMILTQGTGVLANPANAMRSPGAGILPFVRTEAAGAEESAILHIRGTNRGELWPLGRDIPHALCWKEFAGVTGSADELEDPRTTAIMELYEELTLVAETTVLLPADVLDYPAVASSIEIGLARLSRHYGLDLLRSYDSYEPVRSGDLRGDARTRVEIVRPDGETTSFHAIVGYDPLTNALDLSFVTTLHIARPLTGLLSLAGPENDDLTFRPYMEDIVLVDGLRRATCGNEISVRHLLSVHGPLNLLRTPPGRLFFLPSPTLEPLVAFSNGEYSFRRVLERAMKKIDSLVRRTAPTERAV